MKLSHSRGMVPNKMSPGRDIICYRAECNPHCCALVLVQITVILRSIINRPFCRAPSFSLHTSYLPSQWPLSLLTVEAPKHSFCTMRGSVKDILAAVMSCVQAWHNVSFLSLKVMLQSDRVSAFWGGEQSEETGFKQLIKLPLHEISPLISDAEK